MNNEVVLTEAENFIPERYRVDGFLGSGGYGQVYKAFDTVLLRNVAIKLIEYKDDKALVEAQALARCNSPHIVEIYDVIHDDHRVAIVMEKVEPLIELSINSISEMERDAFLELYWQVLKAVQAIHHAGLLHLDLKPSNILYTESGEVKVTDFGLSTWQKVDDASGIYSQSGSWECLSPEHLNQDVVSEATDVFALGIFLYTYMYKTHPFVVDGDISKTQLNISKGEFRSKGLQASELAELEPLVLAMLSKRAAARPSIDQVVSAIEGLRVHTGFVTATMELPPPVKKVAHKRYAIAAAVSIAILLAVGYIFFTTPKVVTTLVVPTLAMEGYEPDGESDSDQNLLSAMIEDEIVSGVINDPSRRLVSKKEWGGTENWGQEAKQSDVDEIIISKLKCHVDFCDVSLKTYEREQGKIIRLSSKRVPTADLLVFGQVIEQILVSELDFVSTDELVVSEISDADLRAYYLFKNKLTNQEFVEDDLVSIERLAMQNPGFLGAQVLLGEAYRNLYDNTDDGKWMQESQELTLQLYKRFPAAPSVMYLDIRNQMLVKDYEAAELILEKLKRIVGLDATQLVLAEAILVFDTNPEKGYQKLLDYDTPRLTSSYYHHRAYMEEALNKFDELEKTATRWRQRFPDSYLPIFFLARSNLVVGRLDKAESLFKDVVEKKIDHDILLNLGISQLLLGKYQDATDNFERVLADSPSSPDVLVNLAEAYKAQGDDRNIEYFEKALELYEQGEQDIDFAHKALILAHLGRRDEALIELQKAARLDNKAGIFFFIAAQVHQILGQDQAAQYNAKEAMSSGWGIHWFKLPWTQALHDRLNKH